MSTFAKAKGAVTLEAFFASAGIELKRIGQGLRSEVCPQRACNEAPVKGADRLKLSTRGDGYWRCFSCGSSGDVVRAASLVWQCNQLAAAQRLIKEAAQIVARKTATAVMSNIGQQQKAIERVIEAIFTHVGCSDEVRGALNLRGIPEDVVDEALALRVIAGLPGNPAAAKAMLERYCGMDALIEAGMWSQGAPLPAAAYRPILFRYGHFGFESRRLGEAEPSSRGPKWLRYGATMAPFVLAGRPDEHVIAKSALDVLSLRALGDKGTLIGLPGDSSWRNVDDARLPNASWFSHIRGNCHIAFDGSTDGQGKASELAASLESAGVHATVVPMPEDADVNDLLMQFSL